MTPNELTGAYVREVRERHKLSRKDFCELLGWPTQTRLGNIEVKDSWKAGNREEIYTVLSRLENGEMPDPITPQDREDAERAAAGDPDTDDDRAEGTFRAVDATELYDAAGVDWDAAFIIEELQEVVPSPTYEPLPPVDHTFSNGEFETWRRCRRKWWLAWYRKLAPRASDWAGPRAIGDRVHRALAMWYVPEGQPRTDPRDALERVITEDWTKVAEESRNRGADEMWMADIAKRFTNATALERVMIEGYVQWLGETGADSELEILGSERVIAADLEVDSRPIRLVGRLDALFSRKSDGAKLFLDHKTVGDLYGVQATLHGNPQVLTYAVLMWLEWLRDQNAAAGLSGDIPGAQSAETVAVSLLSEDDHAGAGSTLGSASQGWESLEPRSSEPSTGAPGLPLEASQHGKAWETQNSGASSEAQRSSTIEMEEGWQRSNMDRGAESSYVQNQERGDSLAGNQGITQQVSARTGENRSETNVVSGATSQARGNDRTQAFVPVGALYNMLKKNKRTTQAKPPFFDRVEVRHNVHELETWTAELLGAARDILAVEDALNAGADHLRVAYRTWNDTCKWGCDFFAICTMFNDGSRVEDAITGLFHEVDPHDRYDSREVAEAVRASVRIESRS